MKHWSNSTDMQKPQ